MKIIHTTSINKQIHAILDNNAVVRMADIKGSPRVGCNVAINDDGWRVVGNNVDEDCVGSACPIK